MTKLKDKPRKYETIHPAALVLSLRMFLYKCPFWIQKILYYVLPIKLSPAGPWALVLVWLSQILSQSSSVIFGPDSPSCFHLTWALGYWVALNSEYIEGCLSVILIYNMFNVTWDKLNSCSAHIFYVLLFLMDKKQTRCQ